MHKLVSWIVKYLILIFLIFLLLLHFFKNQGNFLTLLMLTSFIDIEELVFILCIILEITEIMKQFLIILWRRNNHHRFIVCCIYHWSVFRFFNYWIIFFQRTIKEFCSLFVMLLLYWCWCTWLVLFIVLRCSCLCHSFLILRNILLRNSEIVMRRKRSRTNNCCMLHLMHFIICWR